jgi:hypothetical protein
VLSSSDDEHSRMHLLCISGFCHDVDEICTLLDIVHHRVVVLYEITTLQCIISQKSADFIFFVI